jgi:beta-glucanase (GH16 family)
VLLLDEFVEINSDTWSYEIGDGSDFNIPGWGNNELQCYTSDQRNLQILPNAEKPGDGMLQITSIPLTTPAACVNSRAANTTTRWTSGKLTSKHKKAFKWSGAGGDNCTPIYIESRIKVPMVMGQWAAIWMMPEPQPGVDQSPECSGPNSECGAYGVWPRSGEIDIMEHINKETSIGSTIHFAYPGGWHGWTGNKRDIGAAAIETWNVYLLEWHCRYLKFTVNGELVYEVTQEKHWGAQWVFDQPFYLILNLAVGGNLPGKAAVDWSQNGIMLVDYVRVYQ